MSADKILITTSSFGRGDKAGLNALRENDFEPVLNPYGRRLSESEVSGLLQEVRPVGMVAGVEPLTAAVLGGAPGLRVVSRCGIGLDTVDLDAAASLGISVYNTPDAPTPAVAELTVGLMMDLVRAISAVDASIRRGEWYRPEGRLLGAMTVGIVGCGRIGGAVANILRSFGSRVIGCDPALKEHAVIEIRDFDEVLAQSDLVTLHVPFAPETKKLMNRDALGRLRRGAFLVNASRGGLVDESALAEALNNGQLAGAAVDCFDEEPYMGPLRDCANTVLTAHIGSYARESRTRMENEAVNNLLVALKGSAGA